ncbi:MAG: hypothetical protein U5R49_03585 [Deltaproteobacteria bacterium]|nr:hypothetical protein [Deltaproteobacteria bacterium]
MKTVKVFKYIDQLDAFLVTDEFQYLCEILGMIEWNPVAWIGRLFTLDNDYGEHWFDNWEEREMLKYQAEKLGIPYEDLLVITPDRFKNDVDGPCNPPDIRKKFWTDVLKSLRLSYDTLFEEARHYNELARHRVSDEFIDDLEERIAKIQSEL